jgi:polyhydroxybutyrate depolymerase
MRIWLSATIALLLALSSGGAQASGTKKHSVVVNGTKRTYRMYLPKTYDGSSKRPLIIVLHGGAGDAGTAEWDSRMSEQAEKDGFLVAYPNGWLRTWNADGCCGPARAKRIDDVAFIREMIEQCKRNLAVDPDRIYVTGISNGGMMAYTLAQELPDEIAAIAPVEGCMYQHGSALTAHEEPVSVMAIHGTADHVVPYQGGVGMLFGYKVTAPSVSDTINYWVDRDGCSKTAERSENRQVVRDIYSGGAGGAEVCLYTVKDSGHVWPGGRCCFYVGDRPKKDWSATEAMCEFFWAHPKQHVQESTTASSELPQQATPPAASAH